MPPGDTARLYHRLASYGREREWDAPVDDPRVLRDFEANVRATFPAHCKAYPAGLPVVELPRTWRSGGGSATAVLAGHHVGPPAAVDLVHLARLLHLSAGVVRVAERQDGRRYRFRTGVTQACFMRTTTGSAELSGEGATAAPHLPRGSRFERAVRPLELSLGTLGLLPHSPDEESAQAVGRSGGGGG